MSSATNLLSEMKSIIVKHIGVDNVESVDESDPRSLDVLTQDWILILVDDEACIGEWRVTILKYGQDDNDDDPQLSFRVFDGDDNSENFQHYYDTFRKML